MCVYIPGNTVIAAFEPTITMEHEAVVGAFKCLYWLVKHEIAHHTNYPALLDLAKLLGCQYFEKLKVTFATLGSGFLLHMANNVHAGYSNEYQICHANT